MAKRFIWPGALAALLAVAMISGRVAAQTQAAPPLVRTASAQILVNAQGMTLYLYTRDTHNKSVCTGDCAEYWPPVLVPSGVQTPAALPGMRGTFGITVRADGARQLTYDGAPLYTFVKDKQPGDLYGQGVQGVWWAVMLSARQGAAATPTPSSTGSYYGGGAGGDDQGRHGGHGGGSGSQATPTPTSSYYGGGRDA